MEEPEKDMEEDTNLNPGRDTATNQIRKKEPHVPATTNSNHIGTKYNEAKTNRLPTRGSEFFAKADVPSTALGSVSPPVTDSVPEKGVSSTLQIVTKPPPSTLADTSSSLNSSKTVKFPKINLSGTVETLEAVSIEESQEVSTDISGEENLLTDFKQDTGTDDSSGSSPVTSPLPFGSETISQGYVFSSEKPESITYDVLLPESSRNTSEGSASSGSEDSLKDPSLDGNVWFPGNIDGTTEPDIGSGRESFLQTKDTEKHTEAAEKTTESPSPGLLASQGPSDTDLEMHPFSTLTYFPTEVTPHAFTPSSGQHDLASTINMVHSQTTQPVYNGEPLLQPSYSSEVFPLVTPLLLDNQILNTTPAASSSDSALHAAPVSPSVDMSFEYILSSYDGVPLLPFSSVSFSSELSRHLYPASQILPQATAALESDMVSLHASLLVAGGDVLLEPSLAQYSDVVTHQTTSHAASVTLELGGSESDSFYKTLMFSQVEASSNDVMMHSRSSGPEPSYILSKDKSSHPLITFPYSSGISVHNPADVSHQGTELGSLSHIPMSKASLITPSVSLLQPTHGPSGDGEWSGGSSENEFLLPETDGLTALNISSPVSVTEFTASVFGDESKLSKSDKIYGSETEQKMSSFSEMVYHSESTIVPDLYEHVNKSKASIQDSPVSIASTKDITPGFLPYTATKVFDHEISQVTEKNFSVPHTHTLSQTSDDTLLKPVLSTSPEPEFPGPTSSDMLSPSTQLSFDEGSASFNTEVLLQASFQASGVDTLLKTALPTVHSDLTLVETSKVDQIFPTILHLMASNSASKENMLHTASLPDFVVSPTSVMHAVSRQSLTIPYTSEKYFEPVLFKSKVVPSLYNKNELFQPSDLENNHAFPKKGRRGFATPVLSIDVPLDTRIDKTIYSDEVSTSSKGSKVFTSVPTVISETLVTADYSDLVGNVSVSMTADSPNRDGSVSTTQRQSPSKTTELMHGARSDTNLGEVVDNGVDDYSDDDYDDRDTDSLTRNKCMSCLPYRESQENIMIDSETQKSSLVDQNNSVSYAHSKNAQEENKVMGITSDSQNDMGNSDKIPTNALNQYPSIIGKEENDIQTGRGVLPFTPQSKAWGKILTSDEESGSGQTITDSVNDNETSTDFSFSEVNGRDADRVLEPGNSEIIPRPPQSSTSTITSRHSEVFNISEAG